MIQQQLTPLIRNIMYHKKTCPIHTTLIYDQINLHPPTFYITQQAIRFVLKLINNIKKINNWLANHITTLKTYDYYYKQQKNRIDLPIFSVLFYLHQELQSVYYPVPLIKPHEYYNIANTIYNNNSPLLHNLKLGKW
eukprot:UN07602